jgi:hypothetical protein
LASAADEARAFGLTTPPADTSTCDRCQGSDRYTYTTRGVCANSTDPMCSMAMQAAGIPGPYGTQTRVVSKKCLITAGLLAEPVKYTLSNILLKRLPGALGQILSSNYLTVAALPATVDAILNECSCTK